MTRPLEKLASSVFHMAIISSRWVPSHWHASDAVAGHVAYAFAVCWSIQGVPPPRANAGTGCEATVTVSSVLTGFLLPVKDAR